MCLLIVTYSIFLFLTAFSSYSHLSYIEITVHTSTFITKRLHCNYISLKIIVWKRKLLETVTYIAIKERFVCIITIETVMCILHCRKYHLHDCSRNSHLHNCNKNCHPHICCRNCHLHMCSRNFNCIIATETVTCLIATDVITSIIAIESVSCIVPAETSTFRIAYRNFHLQKWCLSEIHLITKKKLNKWVTTKFKTNSFSTPCIT